MLFSDQEPTAIIIKEDGVYSLCTNVRWESGKQNQCAAAILVNDTPIAVNLVSDSDTGSYAGNSCLICYPLKTNDIVKVFAWQSISSSGLKT